MWDLLVLGGGTAGLVAAKTAARFGATTLLVEAERTGGDCLWTRCVPSKALLAATAAARRSGRRQVCRTLGGGSCRGLAAVGARELAVVEAEHRTTVEVELPLHEVAPLGATVRVAAPPGVAPWAVADVPAAHPSGPTDLTRHTRHADHLPRSPGRSCDHAGRD